MYQQTEVPYNKTVIGTCSCCGGPVCVHTVWGSVIPDTPTCARCGAVKADSFGPVIPMRRPTTPADPFDPSAH